MVIFFISNSFEKLDSTFSAKRNYLRSILFHFLLPSSYNSYLVELYRGRLFSIQMYKERDGEIETGHYFPRSDRVFFFNFKSNLPCHVYLSVVHASVYIYRERQRKWKKQWNRGAQDGKEVTGSFAQSRDIFFPLFARFPRSGNYVPFT